MIALRAALVLGLSLTVAGGALAAPPGHVIFVRSEPAHSARLATSPPRVAASFEKDVARSSTLRLLRSDGSVVETGPAVLEQGTTLVISPPALGGGVYLAHWRAIDPVDGHTLDGYFTFTVGDDAPAPLQGIALAATARDITARLEISPGRLGENDYRLALAGPAGAVRADRAFLRFTSGIAPPVGSADAQLSATAEGFGGRGMELALRGSWKVTALVRLPGGSQDTPFEFTFTAPASQVTPSPTPSPSPSPTPTAPPSPAPTAAATPAGAPASGSPDALVLLAILAALAVGGGLAWLLAARRSG